MPLPGAKEGSNPKTDPMNISITLTEPCFTLAVKLVVTNADACTSPEREFWMAPIDAVTVDEEELLAIRTEKDEAALTRSDGSPEISGKLSVDR